MNLQPSDINGYYCPDDPMKRLSVNDQEAKLISSLVNQMFVLEIGTGLGVSTRALAEKAKTVVSVDPDPWCHENVWPVLAKDLHNVVFLKQIPNNGRFDAIFIDGDHSYEAVVSDIENSRRVAVPGCVYIFHDSRIPDVKKAIREQFKEWVDCSTAAGIGVAWHETV